MPNTIPKSKGLRRLVKGAPAIKRVRGSILERKPEPGDKIETRTGPVLVTDKPCLASYFLLGKRHVACGTIEDGGKKINIKWFM